MGGRCCDGRRPLRHDARAGCALVVSACALAARENLEVAPPAGRRSGDVATAGLISSRVWFGPVPGSP
ncbi:hypothetical protein F511_45441 [Dorcoceras hygrometricum]|uniref:Uncharacterized protein n=1 Tax=Dorcoceras hygrometricum TaxID=472368 RepID=A0A2Z7A372_9LAMI|nr:hypothetical protein F511_45441 [Dorcoceras hygrometricum]